ncbi:MAG TPA: bifunctional DNA-binding transcriptional regulator/O6-methylguanine-DNA methyltransferase Ada [Xanthobacteraceae bacterium]|jgi:AraC family transcriptional regulator of adaptative response/methylated-DNA-[protein]-cysteine methyltransferase
MSARTGSRDNDRHPPFSTEEARWQAVEGRDSAADGRFWYSVETTGVYCRPSCAARRPRREHVRFHASPLEAERAGFRPCKRCRPNAASLDEQRVAAVAEACRAIEQAESLPGLDVLAKSAGMSRFHFHRVFKAYTGLTPKAYADAHRGKRARDELRGPRTITQAIYGSGFNASGRFYETAPDLLGMTPTQYRAGGRGATIRFAVGQCWLGAILVAASERGICAIELGDDPDRLVRGLQDRFPQAQLVGGDPSFERLVARVVGLIEAPANGASLPLDVRGTAFQQRVWQALRKIPPGSTATYAEIALRIGRPKAVRAVAQACAANEIAVAIPCHRVVRTDGSLSGYRWGVARKRALLEREARSTAPIS